MEAVPCPAPRLLRACAHGWSLPSLPSQGLGVLKGSCPPSPGLAPQDLTAGRAWSCPPSTTDPVWGSLCPAADVYWAQQAPSRPRSTHGAPGQTPARPTRSFDVSRPAWDQSRPGCAPPSFPRVASEPAAGFQTHDGGAEISRYGPRGTGGSLAGQGAWGEKGSGPLGCAPCGYF